jgi:16S rRNA (cytidine1402-2'-O)-methyltransferase
VSLPGPTAFVPALTVSGLSPQPFLFYGFLNNKDSKRKKELEELKDYPFTIIFYEAPHRILDTLECMEKILGNRNICISREISKKFEEVYRGKISDIKSLMTDVKGELVIVVEGSNQEKSYDNLSIIEHVNLYIMNGYDKKEARKLVSKDRGISKSDVYKEYHRGEI